MSCDPSVASRGDMSSTHSATAFRSAPVAVLGTNLDCRMHGASLLSHVSSTGVLDVAIDLAAVNALEERVTSFIEAVEEAVRFAYAGCKHQRCKHSLVSQLIDGPSEDTFMKLWAAAHTIDHLPTWEEASGTPSFGTLRTGFNTAMQRLTVAGMQMHLV